MIVSVMKSKESLASSTKSEEEISAAEHEAKLAEQKRKQQELIGGKYGPSLGLLGIDLHFCFSHDREVLKEKAQSKSSV